MIWFGRRLSLRNTTAIVTAFVLAGVGGGARAGADLPLAAFRIVDRDTGQELRIADAGLSLEDVALATGVSAETAKSRLRYARAKLRQALAGEGAAHV